MIRKFLLTTAAIAALAGTAAAADLPSRRAPPVYLPPPIPVFTWTGLYIGGQIGYEFGKSSASATSARAFAANATNPGGVIGGAHIGYLFSTQSLGAGFLGGGGVFGIEGDVDGANYRSTYALGPLNDYSRQNIQGSVRGRLGVAVDRALFYATGGVAFGGLNNTYFNTANGLSDSIGHTRVGWTAGGGIEYAVTNNWSIRAEYRYTDFGTVTDNLAVSTGGATNVRHRETDNRVQAGFSYKFNTFGPVPVVARY